MRTKAAEVVEGVALGNNVAALRAAQDGVDGVGDDELAVVGVQLVDIVLNLE